jgi:isoamylase
VMMNMDWNDVAFDVPKIDGRRWYRAIDTAAASPADIFARGHEPLFEGDTCTVRDRSIVVLISKP